MKKVRFPWRPILKPDNDHWRRFRVSQGLLTPIYRERISDYRRSRYNGRGHAGLVNVRTMENRIVGNVLEKNINFLSRHLILSPTVLEKLKENGVISESIKRQLAFKDTDEQIPFFVQSLNDRGLLTFKKFLAVLKETGHGWMVDVLLSTQALSYEEIASTQPGGYAGPGQDAYLLGERSGLQGMTPEHARMRLTSANLRGRSDSVGVGGYGGTGLGNNGLSRTGVGGSRFGAGGLAGGVVDGGMGKSGLDESSLGQGLGARGLGWTGLTGGMGDRGLDGARLGGGHGNGRVGSEDWRQTSFMQQREMPTGSLLQGQRANAGGSAKFRGQLAPGALFQEPLRGPGRRHVDDMGGNVSDVTGALVNLHDHFRNQSDTNEQNLTVLKREEMAIRELLEQNSREQAKVRKNQNALSDIGRRLEEVNTRANDVYDPVAHSHLSRYRLAQLNQIPWSSSNR